MIVGRCKKVNTNNQKPSIIGLKNLRFKVWYETLLKCIKTNLCFGFHNQEAMNTVKLLVCAESKTFPKGKDLLKVHCNGIEATLLIVF